MKVIMLVQGRKDDFPYFLTHVPQSATLYFLSFDQTVDLSSAENVKCFFLPKSTWAEGRNFLLLKALESGQKFDYYIFCDGDLRIRQGSLSDFFTFLHRFGPDLGLPLTDQFETAGRFLPNQPIQIQFEFDQILQAYSRRVIDDSIAVPYVTDFDKISWWISCEINQFLTFRNYCPRILQLNTFRITNSHYHKPGNDQDSQSIYIGGFNKSHKKMAKNYITSSFGRQGFFPETLFHPWFLPRQRTLFLLRNASFTNYVPRRLRSFLFMLIEWQRMLYTRLRYARWMKSQSLARLG